MAYTRPPAKTSSDTFDLTAYNSIRDSLIASSPDVFTTAGDLYVATGADAGTRLAAGADDSILVYDSSLPEGIAKQIVPAVHVHGPNVGTEDPPVGSWHTLEHENERFDTDGMHEGVTNPSRLTVPANGDGIYNIGATVAWHTDTLGDTEVDLRLRLRLNGTTTLINRAKVYNLKATNPVIDIGIFVLWSLSATDFIELQVRTDTDIDVASSGLWCMWQRRA